MLSGVFVDRPRLAIVIGILAEITGADIEVGLDFMTFVAIAAVFVLSEVFREGARMKEEQDLTV